MTYLLQGGRQEEENSCARFSESAQQIYKNVSVIKVFNLLHTKGHCILFAVIILQHPWVQLVSEVKVIFLLFTYMKKMLLLKKKIKLGIIYDSKELLIKNIFYLLSGLQHCTFPYIIILYQTELRSQ